MDYCEKWGKDVEEAVKLSLLDLKLERDQVEVIVLEQPSRGFLGFGARLAKVRVQKKEEQAKPTYVQKVNIKTVEEPINKMETVLKKAEKQEIKIEEPKKAEKQEIKIKSEPKEQVEKASKEYSMIISKFTIEADEENTVEMNDCKAVSFLNEICEKMGLTLEVTAHEKEGVLYINIEGKDSGTIIGKRGQTLDAVQYLTSLVVNKGREKYMRVIVNAENYREKREKTLQQLAVRLAEKVVKTGSNVRLEPMNPYERKVIHSALQSNPKVSTKSEGEEPYRRVVIEYKR